MRFPAPPDLSKLRANFRAVRSYTAATTSVAATSTHHHAHCASSCGPLEAADLISTNRAKNLCVETAVRSAATYISSFPGLIGLEDSTLRNAVT